MKENNSFIINNGLLRSTWNKQVLWTPQECEAIEWIKMCPTLFAAYTLKRLYQTHKNNECITLHNDEPMAHCLKAITPDTIKQCIEKYLIRRKEVSSIAHITGYVANIFDKFKSLF